MNELLKGKVALITGGARGIGEAESRLLAEQGARIIIADVLDTEGAALAAELGEQAHYQHLDVSNEKSWSSIIRFIEDTFDGLDILVNNAGIIRVGALEDTSLDDYMSVINVNQVGVFLGMRSVTPLLKKRGSGSIVNISSSDGMTGSNGLTAYAASKWAVRGMTKVAARELGPHGIRVNSIHPGGISTAMAGDTSTWTHDTLKHIPLYRAGAPKEIANAVLFLASDMGSYSTGGEFSIDGGLINCNLYEQMPGTPENKD